MLLSCYYISRAKARITLLQKAFAVYINTSVHRIKADEVFFSLSFNSTFNGHNPEEISEENGVRKRVTILSQKILTSETPRLEGKYFGLCTG